MKPPAPRFSLTPNGKNGRNEDPLVSFDYSLSIFFHLLLVALVTMFVIFPLGKLHNLVYDIHLSSRLSWWLRELQQRDLKLGKKPLKVIRDNDTRWLSQLYMIRRALKLRRYFDLLVVEYRVEWKQEALTRKGNLRKGKNMPRIFKPDGQLSDSDWIALERIAEILASFESVVKVLEGDGQIRRRKHGFEGSYGNSWEVLLGFEHILGVLEKAKMEVESFPDPEQFRISINLAWEKLDKYYKSKFMWPHHKISSCRLQVTLM